MIDNKDLADLKALYNDMEHLYAFGLNVFERPCQRLQKIIKSLEDKNKYKDLYS